MNEVEEPVGEGLTEIEQIVADLTDQFGYIKINLLHKGRCNEGIWATPCDEASANAARDDSSSGDIITARLCNHPLGWGGFSWGEVIRARTTGDTRPEATLEMQVD